MKYRTLLTLTSIVLPFALFAENPSLVLWSPPIRCHDIQLEQEGNALLATPDGLIRVLPDFTTQQLQPDTPIHSFTGGGDTGTPIAAVSERGKNVTVYFDITHEGRPVLNLSVERLHHCFQTPNQGWWLVEHNGKIHQITQDRQDTYSAGEFISEGRIKYPFLHAVSPEGKIAFFQQTGTRTFDRDLNGVLIWEKGTIRKLPTEQASAGFCEFLDEKRLLVGTVNGLKVYDVESGEQLEKWGPPKDFFSKWSKPVFHQRLSDGTRILFYAHSDHSGTDRLPFSHGGTLQIVELADGQWRKIPLKLDPKPMRNWQKVSRPAVVEPSGAFWSVNVGSGLVRRDPDGNWSAFDWQNGLPFETAVQMAFESDRLWVIDEKKRLTVLDTRLLNESDSNHDAAWSRRTLAAKPLFTPEGETYLLETQDGGRVLKILPDGTEIIIPFPKPGAHHRGYAKYDYVVNQTERMTLDTEGGLWLFGSFRQSNNILSWKDGTWKFHIPKRGTEWASAFRFETAFQSQMLKGADFRIGTPNDLYYPVYSGDGRIVFRNRQKRVSYFDGLQWHAPIKGTEVGDQQLSGHPFFHAGDVVVPVGEDLYTMKSEDWPENAKESDTRNWKKITNIPRPFGPVQKQKKPSIPKGCPIPKSEMTWQHISAEEYWVGGLDRIGVFRMGSWHPLQTEGTPLASAGPVGKIWKSPSGTLYFQHKNNRQHYSVLHVQPLQAEPTQDDLGEHHGKIVRLKPEMNIKAPHSRLVQQYRLNNGSWSDVIPLGEVVLTAIPQPGDQTLQIRLRGQHDLRESKVFTFTFHTTYDLPKEIEKLAGELGDNTYKVREQAEAALIDLGPVVLKRIIPLTKSVDPEIRRRARRIVMILTPKEDQ